jgi:hypothetical protein
MARGLGSGAPLTLWIRGTSPKFCPRKPKASHKNIFNLVCMSVITSKIKTISLIFSGFELTTLVVIGTDIYYGDIAICTRSHHIESKMATFFK